MNLIFLDTETTGLGPEDRLIQIAYQVRIGKHDGDLQSHYFRPECPISFEAMSVHHITTERILQEKPFSESEVKGFLLKLTPDHIVVAHNAKFDLEMLKKEGVEFKNWIDSKRVAQHLIDSPRYNLQYLRYSLGLNSDGMAHDAAGDVQVLVKLFDFMFTKLKERNGSAPNEKIIDCMTTLSNTPVLLRRFNFGKHDGKTFQEVADLHRDYLVWLYNSEMSKMESERNEDLVYTLKQYLSHHTPNETHNTAQTTIPS